jgi:transposase InsO family protein
MTDACTKYVELVALPDKEALTVTSAIFSKWICRYGLPLELITDQGREFANKMSDELYSLLKLRHQTTSARHPQCNSQVERFNQTIAKYLNSFVNSTTLDWELYLAPLMFCYNTSFHRSVQNTPFFLTYGMEPRLPSFPGPDARRMFYGESSAADLFQRLTLARKLAVESNLEATEKTKEYHDRKAKPHAYNAGQQVLLEE